MANTGKSTRGTGTKKKTTTKSGSGRKKTTGKSTGSRTAAKKANTKYVPTEKDIMVRNEVELLILLAASLILLLSNFGLCGRIGDYLSYFMFGSFGIYAYIIPILLVIGGAFLISNFGNHKAVVKFFASLFMLILLCSLVQLVTVGVDKNMSLADIYKECAVSKYGGGVIGGAVVYALTNLLGIVGSYVVIVILIIAAFVLITEKSVIGGVKANGVKVFNSAKEDMVRLRENNEYMRQEKERRKKFRTNKKLKGVSIENTKIRDREDNDTEIHEIRPEMNDSIFKGNIHIHTESDHTLSQGEMDAYGNKRTSEREMKYKEYNVGNKEANNKEAHREMDANEPFNPMEKIAASKSALDTMSRKPFQTDANQIKIHTEGDSDDKREIPAPTIEGSYSNNNEGAKIIPKKKQIYVLPPLNLLMRGTSNKKGANQTELKATALKLQKTLQNFGVGVTITDVSRGPSVTRYELQPEQGTKVSKITSLTDDIKLNLAVADIRIEAPIPGKAAVGIEVPNDGKDTVYFRELIESDELRNHPSKLAFAAGKDISGKVIVADIAKMPHMLIAGTTGSGKSVFTNSIIMSILYRAKPSEVKLIIVDPKVVEFGVYNGIPHLLIPVVTDPKKAAGALHWAVAEMSDRYKKFAELNVRDLKGYNEKIASLPIEEGAEPLEKLPQIVIIIDELADLMMAAAKEVEEAICRLAQLARAAGIHLVIATQRPSVDVVTGLIKANIPSRVALLVSSGIDSRTIIDMNGAEKLLGNGDMLFYPSGYVKPVRLQGAFISDEEVMKVVNFITRHSGETEYDEEITRQITAPLSDGASLAAGDDSGRDMYFIDAAKFVVEKEKASTSMLQRVFKIGFNRAARIMDQLAAANIIGEEEGTKPRKVLMSMEQLGEFLSELN